MTKMTSRTNPIEIIKIVDLDTSYIWNHNHIVGMDKISFNEILQRGYCSLEWSIKVVKLFKAWSSNLQKLLTYSWYNSTFTGLSVKACSSEPTKVLFMPQKNMGEIEWDFGSKFCIDFQKVGLWFQILFDLKKGEWFFCSNSCIHW